MKKVLLISVMLMVVMGMFTVDVQAQASNKLPAGYVYNIHKLMSPDSLAYADSTSDTLPRAGTYWATNSSTFKLGGVRYADLDVIVKDTCQVEVITEIRIPSFEGVAAGSWTTIRTDTLSNLTGATANAGKRMIKSLRSPETDLIDGVVYEGRIRLNYLGVITATSSPYIKARLLWYP